MKLLLESLITKSNMKNIIAPNKFGITKKDMIGDIEGFPLGVVVKMLEEQEKQGNKPDVRVFQKYLTCDKEEGGFDWDNTKDGIKFWKSVSVFERFDLFYKKYPEYKKYDVR